ncbi:uncharacterized protein F4822DRAFT_428123 [Hypoxylon trugodes]|uniref:uncharacterized protein n=1 Tax=Hypoxylon trugodes TaxID=326681 RepID=UPI00219AA44B|nr:uncharacterized protein F4822DRAFT_428123 [Hypoxylon trugodes]KAI1389780.1 hypothetical protein F4822DRAFT_428123 [Hypoxylon trugodes]
MADLEQDLTHRDLPSSIDDISADPRESTAGGSSSETLVPNGLPDENHEEVLSNPVVIDVPTKHIGPLTTGCDGQIGNQSDHRPKPDDRDKGKAPVRLGEDLCIRSRPIDDTNPQYTTENQENQEEPNPSTDGGDQFSPENGIPHEARPALSESSSRVPDIAQSDETGWAMSPRSPTGGKQKQKMISDPELEPQLTDSASTETRTQFENSETGEAAGFRPLQYGDPGWEKSADRPPKKLPIRFKDAVGRKFVFPWEKGKTWAGMERLIRSCFAHVNVLGHYVNEGRYDLLTSLPFSTDVGAGVLHSSTPPSEVEIVEPQSGGTPSESTMPHAPTPPPAPSVPIQHSAIIILPELWEDLVEPGMYIQMQFWPIDAPPPPPPPPLPHHPPPGHPAFGHLGGGRGRGRGRGMGRGHPGMMGSMPHLRPPPPPGWITMEAPKPRGKTRKRSDGP